ncbi:hypothetical protein [Candidatus Electronema sp. PJ]|uniref:hypothetical protein n=1 Tax=Candidatus Electronema sp. PJ TaxID=3401572 RepID=UPI003AA91B8F
MLPHQIKAESELFSPVFLQNAEKRLLSCSLAKELYSAGEEFCRLEKELYSASKEFCLPAKEFGLTREESCRLGKES